MSARRPDCVVWLGAAFLAGYRAGHDGWAGTAPRHWASSWQSGTQKAPKAQLLRRLSGRGLAVGALQLCAVLLCGFCIWGVGLLVLLLRRAGDFSASVRPPWQRLTAWQDCCATAAIRLYRMLPHCCCVCGWPGGRRSWLHSCSVQRGARHKGNAGDRAAAFEPFCGCNGFVSGCQCCRGRPRPRCRRRAMRAFPPHISDWPAGRRQRLFSAVHG